MQAGLDENSAPGRQPRIYLPFGAAAAGRAQTLADSAVVVVLLTPRAWTDAGLIAVRMLTLLTAATARLLLRTAYRVIDLTARGTLCPMV